MESPVIYPRLIRRVRAVLIDGSIAVFVLLTWWLSIPWIEGYPFFIKIAYPLLAWFLLDPVLVWRLGATPGHLIMNLRIEAVESGQTVGLLRALLRSCLKTLTGGWSFVFVFMTNKRQALHDVLTHTVVVLRDPESVSKRERLPAYEKNVDKFTYPSTLRKVLVIGAYLLLSLLAVGALLDSFVSEKCITANRCKNNEFVVLTGLSWVRVLGVVALLIYGWRSRIFGARRRLRPVIAETPNGVVSP